MGTAPGRERTVKKGAEPPLPASVLHAPPRPWAHLDRQDGSRRIRNRKGERKPSSNFTQCESTMIPILVFEPQKQHLGTVQANIQRQTFESPAGRSRTPDRSPACLNAGQPLPTGTLENPSGSEPGRDLQEQPVAARSLGASFPQPFPPTHRQAGPLPALSPSSAGGSPGLRDTKEWAVGRAREARRLEESAAAWGRGLPE